MYSRLSVFPSSQIIGSTLYDPIDAEFRYLHRVTQCFAFVVMRKQPLNPDVPMKPLYWTRILVPVTASSQASANATESPSQVNKKINRDNIKVSQL